MALKIHCDNPECDVDTDADAGTLDALPAGWWSLEQEDGEETVAYALHSISCVAAFARLHVAPAEEPAGEPAFEA